MTSIPVNGVNTLLNNMVSKSQTVPVTEEAVKESFDTIMCKLNEEAADLSAPKTTNGDVRAKDSHKEASDATAKKSDYAKKTQEDGSIKEKDSALGNRQAKCKDSDGNRKVDETGETEVSKAVQVTGEKLVKDIAELMEVSEEQVLVAMQTLGITELQLFDTQNLRQLLMELSDCKDAMMLITDEALYGRLQDMVQTAENAFAKLGESLNMSEDELQALMEQMVSTNEEVTEPEVSQQAVNGRDTIIGMMAEDSLNDDMVPALEGMKNYSVTIHRDGETVNLKVDVDDTNGEKTVTEQIVAQTENVEGDAGSENLFGQNEKEDSGNRFQNMFQASAPQTSQYVQEQVTNLQEMTMNSHTPETNEIMDQIMDYMKLNLKAETQELEMQLHPASLGNLHVTISAKDGLITAQFTTQNETVRAAVENQLIQLREQFEEQGIKVDAVEVTVANHAYGEQYSQNPEQSSKDRSSEKKQTRRIKLDELSEEELTEDLEEADRITVDMMRQNGNSVDYMA